MTVTSPDIDILDFKAVYDLTGAIPVVKLTNQSSGPNLAAMSYWFKLVSPSSGIIYHLGTEAAPDRVGVWAPDWQVPEPIPMIQGHIDWSGSYYQITGYAKDSANTIFEMPVKSTKVCRPTGNKLGQKNNFGGAKMNVMMNCTTGKLFVEDLTIFSYNGIAGTQISKNLKLVFPPDATDNTPLPFEQADLNTATIPITYSSKNFQLLLDAVYEYDMGESIFVRIKYKYKACFDINCGTELCCILCSIEKYENALTETGCTADEREKLLLILSKLVRALAGIMLPLCGINVPKLIAEIKELTGDCSDEYPTSGINPANNCAVPVGLIIETGE